jgi:hypothetical protein
MPKQFVNPEAAKLEDLTASDASAQKRIERVAEKAAEKASRTKRRYDGNQRIFSKWNNVANFDTRLHHSHEHYSSAPSPQSNISLFIRPTGEPSSRSTDLAVEIALA